MAITWDGDVPESCGTTVMPEAEETAELVVLY